MTKERALELVPILQAYAEGKTIQWWNEAHSKWSDVGVYTLESHISTEHQLRIKPEPKIVPFDYEDDIIGKIIKNKFSDNPIKKSILSQDEKEVLIPASRSCETNI